MTDVTVQGRSVNVGLCFESVGLGTEPPSNPVRFSSSGSVGGVDVEARSRHKWRQEAPGMRSTYTAYLIPYALAPIVHEKSVTPLEVMATIV